MWEYLFYILCVALFALVWYNVSQEIEYLEDQEQYVKRLEEDIKSMSRKLEYLETENTILDEELNGYERKG